MLTDGCLIMYRPSQDSVADCADESRIVSAGVATNGSSIHQKHGSPGLSIIVAPEVKVPFSLAQVAVFLAVARTGSPTSASLECSISQPAVSKSLSGLEQVSQQRSDWQLPFLTLQEEEMLPWLFGSLVHKQ